MSKRNGTRETTLAVPDRHWTAAEGGRVIAAWQKSGLSVREFARRHELDAQRVQWWKRKLVGVRGAAVGDREAAPAHFVPVITRRAEDAARAAAIVRIGSDIVIEVHEPSIVAPGWLAAMLSELMRTRE